MKHIKHWLATMAALLCSITASAHDFEVGGIYFNITSEEDLTVEVTYKGWNMWDNDYSGSITIPTMVTYDGVDYNITSIGKQAFISCKKLTSITIPESVTSIGNGAFSGCSSLTTITIPEGVTSIGGEAFELTPWYDNLPDGEVYIGKVLYGYKGTIYFTPIEVRDGTVSISPKAFSYQEGLTSITIPESVTSIGSQAFYDCGGLTSINIPEGVTSIERNTFSGCTSLTAITIPANVTSIGEGAFEGCSSLTSITIPESSQLTSIESGAFDNIAWYNNHPDGVVYIGNVLYRYKGVTSQNILVSVKVKEGTVSISNDAFSYQEGLTFITIPESVTSIGDRAFSGCSRLTGVNISENPHLTSIGQYAFEGCYNLASITIPTNVTSIRERVFYGCSSLTSITIPESVTSIEDYAFYECRSLASVTISEQSQLTSIGVGAFCYCGFTSITIPESVMWIENGVFADCSSLTDVYCYAKNIPSTESYAFDGSPIENATLHVHASALERYKATAPWSSFGNIVSIMPEDIITITTNEYGSGTYCSEYALDFSEVEGLKAYVAAGYDSETGVVTLLRVMTANAGVGLFVKGEPGDYVVPTLESTSYNALNMLVGTLEETTVNSTDGSYTNYKYTIREGDAEPKFYPFADASTQAAGRAYLQIPTAWLSAAEQKSISIRFDEGEGTTDIENTEFRIQNSEFIYDLMGRRVANPTKGGIYIVNGKKTVF